MGDMGQTTLAVKNWTVRYRGRETAALCGLNFNVQAGECLAVIGRSGAGKSTLLHTLTSLGGQQDSLVSGSLSLCGRELLAAGDFEKELGSGAHRNWQNGFEMKLGGARGAGIFTIFQEPRSALNPYRTLGDQLREASVLGGHTEDPGAFLDQVEISREYLSARPLALSVGMCQRFQIAMALALRSKVVLADEPLARIDPRGRGRVFALLKTLLSKGSSLILVSHDPELVRRLADSVLMLQQGFTIEAGRTADVFSKDRSHHPFFLSFLESHDRLRKHGEPWSPGGEEMTVTQPVLGGCPLRASCWAADTECESWHGAMTALGESHEMFCFKEGLRLEGLEETDSEIKSSEDPQDPIVWAEAVSKSYEIPRGFFKRERISAVERASLKIYPGETLALVGESGGGKTTLVNMLSGLMAPDEGRVRLNSESTMPLLGGSKRQRLASRFQLVFQEADQAMNPSWSVLESVAEVYTMNFSGMTAEMSLKLGATLLQALWLEGELTLRRPQSLSGGERKRAVLARALAALGWGVRRSDLVQVQPGVLFLDEPLSGLDPVVQGQCLRVLLEAKTDLNVSLFLITHDLGMAQALADRVMVMYGGEIVEKLVLEEGKRFSHPFSLQLLSPWAIAPRALKDMGPGCVFFSCCDHDSRGARCRRQQALVNDDKSQAACWVV
jgi:peptide/nickel transport system ATP-binding protein